MERYVAVMITAPNDMEASIISQALVDEKLIACANRFPVRSVYRWQDNVENEAEVMLICKTLASNLDHLIVRVKELHSYEVPEIIALPILGGSKEYLEWIEMNTS